MPLSRWTMREGFESWPPRLVGTLPVVASALVAAARERRSGSRLTWWREGSWWRAARVEHPRARGFAVAGSGKGLATFSRTTERSERDSNPRDRLTPPTRFPIVLLQPLGHRSNAGQHIRHGSSARRLNRLIVEGFESWRSDAQVAGSILASALVAAARERRSRSRLTWCREGPWWRAARAEHPRDRLTPPTRFPIVLLQPRGSSLVQVAS